MVMLMTIRPAAGRRPLCPGWRPLSGVPVTFLGAVCAIDGSVSVVSGAVLSQTQKKGKRDWAFFVALTIPSNCWSFASDDTSCISVSQTSLSGLTTLDSLMFAVDIFTSCEEAAVISGTTMGIRGGLGPGLDAPAIFPVEE